MGSKFQCPYRKFRTQRVRRHLGALHRPSGVEFGGATWVNATVQGYCATVEPRYSKTLARTYRAVSNTFRLGLNPMLEYLAPGFIYSVIKDAVGAALHRRRKLTPSEVVAKRQNWKPLFEEEIRKKYRDGLRQDVIVRI
jgi:hypothetical protein